MSHTERNLHVAADLQITHALGDLRITGDGGKIVVELPGLALGRELARTGAGVVGNEGLRRLDSALKSVGLSVDVCLKQRCLARLGRDVNPRFLDRALGVSPFSISPIALLRSLMPR